MMWRSRKAALDLLRDPRCTVHSTVSNRDATEGEFKVYGRAEDILNLTARLHYTEALYEKIGFKPEEPEYHLFSIDIDSVAFAILEDDDCTEGLEGQLAYEDTPVGYTRVSPRREEAFVSALPPRAELFVGTRVRKTGAAAAGEPQPPR